MLDEPAVAPVRVVVRGLRHREVESFLFFNPDRDTMPAMRFTLSKLFMAVTMITLACAGMAGRNQWWADVILTVTFLLYASIAIRAAGLSSRERAAAIVFAVVGAAYLFFVTCSLERYSLLTNVPLAALATWMGVQNSLHLNSGGMNWETIDITIRDAFNNPYSFGGSNSELRNFFLIGHCVWSWVFALLAGWFAGAMYAKRSTI